MRLYLVRHPRPEVGADICYGQSDIGLADDPAACATRLRPLLPADAPLYSSPLQRCKALAEALHPAPLFDDRLKEIHFGAWEMKAWDDIDREALDAWAAATLEHAPPGGESVAQLYARVSAFIRERHAAGDAELVLVTHAGVMKVCCSLLLGLPTEKWQGMRFEYGTVTRIEKGELVWHNKSDE